MLYRAGHLQTILLQKQAHCDVRWVDYYRERVHDLITRNVYMTLQGRGRGGGGHKLMMFVLHVSTVVRYLS